ncbi:Por secretion system C-terminal sorting domain-containing protein [Mesonia phycicola]|uniref:Por secretion system C-terminal sorting domain-containing protein n=1 Tax=Mesonia phycicola TaxID=579105 RepID=A0A1M6G8X5_9FLAO|nr:fibronectin type III domain-containing protein [Mesonia phycicola]SHJ06334.1 Por secretion system C-terminal sorting domain-containing protein [Mesonia phycicola]
MKKKYFNLFGIILLLLSSLELGAQVFTEDFESGLGVFSNDVGNNVNWTVESSIVNGGSQSVKNVYTANNNNVIYLTSSIDLTAFSGTPYLEFYHIAKVEGNFDEAIVEFSTDGGVTFAAPTASEYIGAGVLVDDGTFDEDSYSDWGTTATTPTNSWWKKEQFDLSAYDSSTQFVVRFRLESDGSLQRSGWYLDDVAVVDVLCAAPTPASVALTGSSTTATLSWSSIGSAWDIEYGASGFTPGAGTTVSVTSNPYTVTGLAPSADYDFYLRENCGSGSYSSWVGPFSYTTACGVYSSPYIDDLESYSASLSLSTFGCWLSGSDGTYDWNIDSNGSTPSTNTGPSGAYSGSNYLYVEGSSGSSGDEAWLESPSVDISSLTAPALSFYYHMYGADIGTLHIDVGNGSTWDNDVFVISGEQQTAQADPWVKAFVDLSVYSGVVQFRFRAERGSGSFNGDISLDDIAVENGPSCYPPSSLSASNITASAAGISWSSNSTSWDIEYGFSGFTPTGTPVVSGVTSNPYTLTGLSSQTSYDIYVRSNCGAGDLSTWVGPLVVETLCPSYLAPWFDDVESHATTTSFDESLCWIESSTGAFDWNIDGNGGTPSSSTGPSGAYSGVNYFYVEGSSGAQGDVAVLETPLIDVSSVSNPGLKFFYHMYGSAIVDLRVDFFDGTAWNNDAFVVLGQQQTSDTDPWLFAFVNFSSYTITGPVKVRFKAERGGALYNDVAIDDISIESLPSCIEPYSVVVDNISQTTADVSWIDYNGANASGWDIEYGPLGFTQGTGTTVSASTSPFTVTGLTSGVEYDMYIQTDCGGGDFSSWEGPYTFETLFPGAGCNVNLNVASIPYSATDNTGNYQNNNSGPVGSGCGSVENYLNGYEVYYEYTPAADEMVDILMSNLSNFYAGVFVYTDCADVGSSCVAGAVAGPSDADFGIEDFQMTGGTTYYILVSSWLTSTVGYTLDIVPFSCSSVMSPTGPSPQDFVGGDMVSDLEVNATESPSTFNWYAGPGATNPILDTELLVDNTTYYVTQTYNGCESAPLAITVSEIDCSALAIVSSAGNAVSCQGSMQLTATGSGTGDDLYWYDVASGGDPLAFGGSFDTPILTSTTSYWVSEVRADGYISAGNAKPAPLGTSDFGGSNYGVKFTATQEFTILDVEIYPLGEAGTFDIVLIDDSTSSSLYTQTVTVANLNGTTPVTVPLNFVIPPGNYRLVQQGSIDLVRDSGTVLNSFPYPIGPGGSLGSVTSGSTGTNGNASANYYYFFNWTVSTGELVCESPRTEVVATVNQTGDVLVDYTSLPYTTNDSTSIYGNNFEGNPGSSCPGSNYLDGYEVVYQYTADPLNDDILQIELTGITNLETGMYIYTSCGDIGINCLDGGTNDDTSSSISISDYEVLAGETLYIVISSESNTVNYTLDIYGFDCATVPLVGVSSSPYFISGDYLSDISAEAYVHSTAVTWYTDAALTMPIADPTTEVLVDGNTYYVTQTVLGCESAAVAVTVVEFDCSALGITQIDDIIICSPGGDVNLSAIAGGTGNEIIWYDAATGGDVVATGSDFTSTVTQTTSYWVSEAFTGDDIPVSGFAKPNPVGTSDFGGSNYGVKFTANQLFTLYSVEVYPLGEAGTFDIELVDDDTNTVLRTVTVTVPDMDGTTPVTVNLGFEINPGNYRLVQQGVIDMVRDYSASYPYPIGVNSVYGDVTSGTYGASGVTTQTYYYFFNWTVGAAEILCESPRTEVTITVNDVPTATPTGNGAQDFCDGSTIADLVVTGTDVKWYSSDVSSSPLAINSDLVDGEIYYASQTIDSCESDGRLAVIVSVKDNSDLPIATVNQPFVQGDTVESLIVFGDNLTWYTSVDGLIFTQIDPSQVTLQDQNTYYVTQTSNGLCESEKLAITVHVGSLDVDDPLFANLNFYPNPMRDNITIENTNAIDQVEVYSLLGQKVIEEHSTQNIVNLNVSHLATGTYFVKVTVSGKLTIFKVVKE